MFERLSARAVAEEAPPFDDERVWGAPFTAGVAVGEGDIPGVFVWLVIVIVASTDCAVKAFGGSYL